MAGAGPDSWKTLRELREALNHAQFSPQRTIAMVAIAAGLILLPLTAALTLRVEAEKQRQEIAQHEEVAAFQRAATAEAERGAGVAFRQPEPAYRGRTISSQAAPSPHHGLAASPFADGRVASARGSRDSLVLAVLRR